MGSPAIFKGNFVKFLKSRFELFNNWKFFADSTSDPTSVAFDASAGSLFARSGTNQLYKKFGSGSSTNWKLLDQPIPFFQVDPLGDIDSMPDTSPLANTGGTLTLSTTGAEVGFGFQSIKFVTTGSGQIVERDPVTVPLGLRTAGLMGIKALVKCNSTFTVRLVDDTNAVNIFEETFNTSNSFKVIEFTGSMQSSCASLHWEFESSTSDTLLISKIDIAPDISLFSKELVNIEDWTSFTPTGSWTTNTTYTGKYRRVGDSAELRYTVSLSGAPDAVALTVNMPSGLTIDTTKLPSWGAVDGMLGYGQVTGSGGRFTVNVIFNSSSLFTIRLSNVSGTYDNLGSDVNSTTPFVFASGDKVTLTIPALPITGWEAKSNNLLTNSDTVKPSRIKGGSTVAGATGVTTYQGFSTLEFDDDSLFVNVGAANTTTIADATRWVAPRNGYIHVRGCVTLLDADFDTAEFAQAAIFQNSTQVTTWGSNAYATVALPDITFCADTLLKVNKGDFITIGFYHEAGADVTMSANPTRRFFEVFYIDLKPVIGLGNEVCILKEFQASGTNGGTSTTETVHTRTLNTIEGDQSFVSLSSNQITLQPGKYSISASAPASIANRHQLFLYNTTDSSYDLEGQAAFTTSSATIQTNAFIEGTITITAAKTFEIRHYIQNGSASTGLGIAANATNNPQTGETFTVVRIEKLK